jgi:prepilin-type N-terminal cleavage/methylation domain-containing protein
MKGISLRSLRHDGFTAVEFMVAVVVLGIIVGSLVESYNSVRLAYTTARQLNEVYTVLSACPEVDRALQFDSITSTTNCYPNNSFSAENGGPGTITYAPTLTVTPTTSLPNTDPLASIPDSKVLNISVGLPAPNQSAPALQLRMLISRNGIAQQ